MKPSTPNRTAALAAAFFVLGPAGVQASPGPEGTTVDYVLGTHAHAGGQEVAFAICLPEGDTPELNVGGGCDLETPNLDEVRIGVHDHEGNPVGFYWKGHQVADGICWAEGHGYGTALVSLRNGDCRNVGVVPDIGSTSGTITVV